MHNFHLEIVFHYDFCLGSEEGDESPNSKVVNYLANDPVGKHLLRALAIESAFEDIGSSPFSFLEDDVVDDLEELEFSVFLSAMKASAAEYVSEFLTEIAIGKGREFIKNRLGWNIEQSSSRFAEAYIDNNQQVIPYPFGPLPRIPNTPPFFAALLERDRTLSIIHVSLIDPSSDQSSALEDTTLAAATTYNVGTFTVGEGNRSKHLMTNLIVVELPLENVITKTSRSYLIPADDISKLRAVRKQLGIDPKPSSKKK